LLEFFAWSNIFIGGILWEDIRNMKQSNNNLMQNEDGDVNGMPEIKNESIKNECENITQIKWEKTCPKCNKSQTYSNKYKLLRAIQDNSKCIICRQQHRKFLPDVKI